MSIRDLFRVSDPARLQDNLARLRSTVAASVVSETEATVGQAAVVADVAAQTSTITNGGAQAARGSILQRLLGTIDHGRIQANIGMLQGVVGESAASRGVAELAEAAASHEPAKVVGSLVERLGRLGFRRV